MRRKRPVQIHLRDRPRGGRKGAGTGRAAGRFRGRFGGLGDYRCAVIPAASGGRVIGSGPARTGAARSARGPKPGRAGGHLRLRWPYRGPETGRWGPVEARRGVRTAAGGPDSRTRRAAEPSSDRFSCLCARFGGEELAVGRVGGFGSRPIWRRIGRFRAISGAPGPGQAFLAAHRWPVPACGGFAGGSSCPWKCSKARQLLRRRPAGAVRGGEGRIRTRSVALAGVREGWRGPQAGRIGRAGRWRPGVAGLGAGRAGGAGDGVGRRELGAGGTPAAGVPHDTHPGVSCASNDAGGQSGPFLNRPKGRSSLVRPRVTT